MKNIKVLLDEQAIMRLKSAVQTATDNNIKEFVFETNKLLTLYAKGLTEFLEGKEDVGYFLFRGTLRVPEKSVSVSKKRNTKKNIKVLLDEQAIMRLKSAVQTATDNNVKEFVFESNKLLTLYAKSLMEFLEGKEDVGYFLFRGSLRVPEKK